MGLFDKNLNTPDFEKPVSEPSAGAAVLNFLGTAVNLGSAYRSSEKERQFTLMQEREMEGTAMVGDLIKTTRTLRNQGRFDEAEQVSSEGLVRMIQAGYDPGKHKDILSMAGIDFGSIGESTRDRTLKAFENDPMYVQNYQIALGQGMEPSAAQDLAMKRTAETKMRSENLTEGLLEGTAGVPQAMEFMEAEVRKDLELEQTFTKAGYIYTKDDVTQRRLNTQANYAKLRPMVAMSFAGDPEARKEALARLDAQHEVHLEQYKAIEDLAATDLDSAQKKYYVNALTTLIASAGPDGWTNPRTGEKIDLDPATARLAVQAYKADAIRQAGGFTAGPPLQEQELKIVLSLMKEVPSPKIVEDWKIKSQEQQLGSQVDPFDDNDRAKSSSGDVGKTIKDLGRVTENFKAMGSDNKSAQTMAFSSGMSAAGVIGTMDQVLSVKDTEKLVSSGYRQLGQELGKTDPVLGRAFAWKWSEAHKEQEFKANRQMNELAPGLFKNDGEVNPDGVFKAATAAVESLAGNAKLNEAKLISMFEKVTEDYYGGDKIAAIKDRGKRAQNNQSMEERRFFAKLNSGDFFSNERIDSYNNYKKVRDTHKKLRTLWEGDMRAYDEGSTPKPLDGFVVQSPVGEQKSVGVLKPEPESEPWIKVGINPNIAETPGIVGWVAQGVEAIGDLIGKGESGGSYDAVNRGTSGGSIVGSDLKGTRTVERDGRSVTIPISQMTVREIQNYQNIKDPNDPNRIFAVGKYQVIPETLNGFLRSNPGVSPNAVFDEELQDRVFEYLISAKRPKVAKFLKGENVSLDEALLELAKEWASFPVPKDIKVRGKLIPAGSSYYGSGNKANISLAEARALLTEYKAG